MIRSFRPLLRALRRPIRNPQSAIRNRAGRWRPVLELLEDRTLLAVFMYDASTNPAIDAYTLRLSGSDFQVVETANPSNVLAQQTFAGTDTVIIVGENGASDTLTISLAGNNPVSSGGMQFDGGSGAGIDSLALQGGTFNTATYNFTNANDGSISLDPDGPAGAPASTITYTGLEPVSSTVTASTVILNYSTASETIRVQQNPGDTTQTRVTSTSGETVDFNNPTDLLEINAGDTGDDIVSVEAFGTGGGGFSASLTIDGGTGSDTVNLNTGLSLASGNDVDVTADTIFVGNSADIVTTGDGLVRLIADRNIFMSPGTSISTDAGNITLEANQGAPLAGSFFGIFMSTATITSVDGDIALQGRGGDDAATGGNRGIVLIGSTISSTGTGGAAGTITLTGNGGTGTLRNDGVAIVGSSVSSVDGKIVITGTAGSGSDIENIGIRLDSADVVSTGAASITLNGSGGSGTDQNIGVLIVNASSQVTSVNGIISITGRGGPGTGQLNSGVLILDGSQVTSAGTGASAATITIDGTGGGGTDFNSGVDIELNGARVTSVDGAIQITGTRGAGAMVDGEAIVVADTGSIGSTGTAAITLIGDSMQIAIDGTIDANTQTVTLRQETNGTGIDLGGADAASTLGLTDDELDRITAGTLRIGSVDAGNITITAAIDLTDSPAIPILHLITGGAIIDTNSADADLTVTGLALEAVSGIGSGDAIETAVSTLAASNTTSGDVLINNSVSGLLTIGTVDGVVGVTNADPTPSGGNIVITNLSPMTVTSNVIDSAGGDITLTATDDAAAPEPDTLTISALVQASGGAGNITLTGENLIINSAGGTEVLNSGAGAITANITDTTTLKAGADVESTGGTITLNTDDMVIDPTSSINATSAGIVTIVNTSANRPINLGTNVSGQLSLTDAELDRITADTLDIGNATSGDITVSDDIDTANINSLVVVTGGSITINSGASITEGTLDMTADDNFDFQSGSALTVTGAIIVLAGQADLGAIINILGTVSATSMSVTGGDGSDLFNVVPSATTPISIDGADPTAPASPGDVLNFDGQGQSVTFTATEIRTSGRQPVSYTNIETINFSGTGGALTVEGDGNNNMLVVTLTGTGDGSFQLDGGPVINFSGLTLLTWDADGETSTPGDSLEVGGIAFLRHTYNYTNGHDGNIQFFDGTATFTLAYLDLEPLTNTGNATDIVFNLPPSSDNAELSDLGGGMSRLRSIDGVPTFEVTDFANPTGSLTINMGDGNDTLTVVSLEVGFPDVIVDGQANTDTVTLNAPIDLTGGLLITSETINLNNATVNADDDVTLNGAVNLGDNVVIDTAATGGDVTLNGTVNGAFSLTVNSTGITTFGGVVGGTNPLTTLTTNAGGTTAINTTGINTTGNQTYNDPVNLGANTTLSAGAGNVTFAQTINGAFSLTVNSTGTTTFGGIVGGITPLTALTTNAGGTTAINTTAINTTGNQTYNDPVNLGANTVLSAGAGNVTFAQTVNGAFSLTVNSTGTTTFGGIVGGATPLTTLTTNAGGTTAINGGSVTTTGNQTYNDAVTLGANTVLDAGAGNVTLANTVNGAFSLTVNSTGTTTFGGAVGGTTPLTTLLTNVGGTTAINGGSITTSGSQTYQDPVTLGANATLSGGSVTFEQTVDGGFGLTVNSAGATTFGGAVGSTTALTNLTTDAPGTTAINGGSVRTTGNQTYNDPVTLGANTLIDAGAGNVTFANTVNGAFSLTVNSAGTTTFGGIVGSTTALTTLTTDANGTTAINTTAINTTGNQTYNDPVTLGANTVLEAGAGNVTFAQTVNGAFSLTVNSTGTTTFGGVVGGNAPLTTLTTNAGGTTAINTTAINTSGNQTYNDPVTLGANTVLSAGAGNVTFAQTVNGAFSLTVNSTGTTTFSGAVGGVTPLTTLTTNAGGTTAINGGSVTTTGNQTYGDPVTLGANTVIDSSAGDVTFAQTVNGAFSLTVNSTGTTTFGGLVGGTTALTMLTTNAGGTTAINGGGVTTTGSQTYNDPVTLGANAVLNGGSVTFNDTVDGGFSLTVNSAGATTFGGAVGSTTPLTNLTTDAGGTTALNGGSVTTSGNQTYNDPVTLGANTILSAGGNVTFAQTVNGAVSLTVNSPATTTFGGAVGGATPLTTLTTNAGGTTAINGGSITTTDDQTYGDAVTLGANTVLDAGAGDVTLANTVNGAFSLTVNSTGTTTFGGVVGGTTPLTTLTTNAGGMTAINGGSITTTDDQTYNDPVTLGANATLNAGAGDSRFAQTVNGAFSLTANSSGTTTFSAAVGGATPLTALTTNAGGTTAINGGSVRTTGNQTYGDPVILGANTVLDAGAGNVRFAQTVNGAFSLTVNSTGTTTFDGVVGGTTPLTTLTTNAGGTTAINGGTITTTSNQTYGDAVTLGANTVINAGAGNVTFAQTVNGASSLTVNSTGTTTFGGAVGGVTRLTSLTTNAGGTTAINGGSIRTTGNQTYNDAVNLGANTTIDASAGGVTFNQTVSGNTFGLLVMATGNIAFNGTATFTNLLKLVGGGSNDAIVQDVTVTNSPVDGLQASNLDSLTIVKGRFENNTGDGFDVSDINTVTLTELILTGNGSGSGGRITTVGTVDYTASLGTTDDTVEIFNNRFRRTTPAQQQIAYTDVNTLIIRTGAGEDTIRVRGTATGTATSLIAGTGADTVIAGSTTDSLDGIAGVVLDAGDGDDQLILRDQGDANVNVYAVSPTNVTRNSVTVVTYASISKLTLFADNAASGDNSGNTVDVSPSATTDYVIDAGGPAALPGDLLELQAQGRAVTDNGTAFTVSGFRPVRYINFERVTLTDAGSITVNSGVINDTLILTATNRNSGNYVLNGRPVIGFAGVASFTFNSNAGNDLLRIENPGGSLFAPTSGIRFNAGAGNDTLELVNGGSADVEETYDPQAGTIRAAVDSIVQNITFTGVSTVLDTMRAGQLTVNGTVGADQITLRDDIDSDGTAECVRPECARLSINSFAPIEFSQKTNVIVNARDTNFADTITINYTERPPLLETITFNTGAAADPINVQRAAPVAAVIVNTGSGADLIQIDHNASAGGGSVDLIRSNVTINAGDGSDTLRFVDRSDSSSDRVTITRTGSGAGTVGRTAGDTFFGSGGGLIFTGLENMTLAMGSGSDIITVTPVNGLPDGSGDALRSIQVDGGGNTDSLIANGTAASEPFLIKSTFVDGPGAPIIYSTIERVTVNGLGGNDRVTVASTVAPPPVPTDRDGTTVTGGTGDDSFIVQTGSLAGRLRVQGDSHDDGDELAVRGTSGNDTFVITRNTIDRTGDSRITYETIERVTINGGAGDDTVTVRAPLTADLTVDGDSHVTSTSDDLFIEATPSADNFTVTNQRVLINGKPVNYTEIENLTLRAFAGADTIDVQSTTNRARTTVLAGADDDTINVGLANSLQGIQGTLRVNGESNDPSSKPAVGCLDLSLPEGDTLVLNDQNGPVSSYLLKETTFERPSTATVFYATLEVLRLNTSNNPDNVTIESLPPSFNAIVVAGRGNDMVTVLANVQRNLNQAVFIDGDAGNDTLLGGSGVDCLFGNFDEDSVVGGLGDDVLDGGRDPDRLLGGLGFDVFLLEDCNQLLQGEDRLLDFGAFEPGQQAGIFRLRQADDFSDEELALFDFLAAP